MAPKNPSLLPRYEALRGQLQHALVVDEQAGELLHGLRTLDAPPPEPGVAVSHSFGLLE